jgi:serine/threonine protein phosphatase PrpC
MADNRLDLVATALRNKLQTFAQTDTGRVRDHNEDSVGSDPETGLFVLADGMGGYNAGEVASGIAVKTVMGLVRDACSVQALELADSATGKSRPAIILRDAVLRANKLIHQTSKTQVQCEGMGTTVVACLFHDNRVSIAHVGDSRIYRLRGDQFTQLTQDHSLLQELVARGFYTPEEAARSTNKNYVTRALGVDPTVEVDIQDYPAEPGDCLLLCSDGLSDMVADEDMQLTLQTFGHDLAVAGRQLVKLANEHGGRDNISVMLVRVLETFPARKSLVERLRDWMR